MTNQFQLLLEDFFNILKSAKSPIIHSLDKGIDKKDIDKELQSFKWKFPTEVYDLYKWKNGISDNNYKSKSIGELIMFNMGIFFPFDIANYYYRGHTLKNSYWNSNLFPLFGSGGGDYYLINCNADESTYGTIFFYSPSDPDFQGNISIFDSLQNFFQTIIECYKTGVYHYDFSIDSYLKINYEEEAKIAKRHNTHSAYWKLFDKSQ